MALESDDCHLKKEFGLKDWLYWNLVLALPLVTALIGIGKQTVGGLIFYLILAGVGIGLILRFFCPHCPHYSRGKSRFSCLFFYKFPKIFPDRKGPLDGKGKLFVVLAGFLILVVPIFWLIEIPSLLIIYIMAVSVLVATHRRSECGRCIFVDCPLNRVPDELHAEAREMK